MKTRRDANAGMLARTYRRGFTLIELLLVLVILASLAAIVVPRFTKRSEKAKITAAKVDIDSMKTALKMYETDCGGFPDNLTALMQQPSGLDGWSGPYLEHAIPKDPWRTPISIAIPASIPALISTCIPPAPTARKARTTTLLTGKSNDAFRESSKLMRLNLQTTTASLAIISCLMYGCDKNGKQTREKSPSGNAMVQVSVKPGSNVTVLVTNSGEADEQKKQMEMKTSAAADISALGLALKCFNVDCGGFPDNLSALMQQPSGLDGWSGPYLERAIPKDAWGHPYIYRYPGQHSGVDFDLYSAGPDGQEGTDDDIVNWEK